MDLVFRRLRPARGSPPGRSVCCRAGLSVGRLGHGLEDSVDDLIGIDALGVGVEVGEDAVPQHGPDHGADVAGADGQAAVEDGPGLGRQDDVLGGAGPGAPGQPVLDEVECAGLLGTGGPHQVHRVVDHVVAGRDLADELLDPEQVAAREDRLGPPLARPGSWR